MLIHTFTVGQMAANCYICIDEDTQEAIIVDPGDDGAYINDQIQKLNIFPKAIIATHGHFDHIMSAFELQMTWSIPFYLHIQDWFLLAKMSESAMHFLGVNKVDPSPQNPIDLPETQKFKFGHTELSILHLPGHTPGSIALYNSQTSSVISGDVLFINGTIGRTDFLYSNREIFQLSLKKLFCLPSDTTVFPGHGEVTTLLQERIYFSQSV